MFSDQGPAPYLIVETRNTRFHHYVRPRTISEMTNVVVESPDSDEYSPMLVPQPAGWGWLSWFL